MEDVFDHTTLFLRVQALHFLKPRLQLQHQHGSHQFQGPTLATVQQQLLGISPQYTFFFDKETVNVWPEFAFLIF